MIAQAVSRAGTAKLRDLESDPHINLSYYDPDSREWISVSGVARASRDRAKVHELCARLENVVGDEGGEHDGTADDPRIVLIGVEVHAAVYLEVNKPAPVILYEMARGWLTGTEPKIGEVHEVRK